MKLRKINENIIRRAKITDIKLLQNDLGIEIGDKIDEGSFSEVYLTNKDGIIVKITSDISDAKNLLKASKEVPNAVPKIYASSRFGIQNGVALLMEYVNGRPIPLVSNEILAILQNDDFDINYDRAKIRILNPKPDNIIRQIIKSHNLTRNDIKKLSNFIHVLQKLSKIGIDVVDFDQNVIDIGDRYVIVDLGEAD